MTIADFDRVPCQFGGETIVLSGMEKKSKDVGTGGGTYDVDHHFSSSAVGVAPLL